MTKLDRMFFLRSQSDDDDDMAIGTRETYGMLAQTLQNIPVFNDNKIGQF